MNNKYLNKIIYGDCIKVMKDIPDNYIDMVITSPPYNVGIDYDNYDDNKDWEEYYDWCKEWMSEIYRILKPDGRFCLNHYLSLGNAKRRESPISNLNYMCCNEIGFKHHSIAVWLDKTLSKRTAFGSWLSASAPYQNCPFECVLVLYKEIWKKQTKGESTIDKELFLKMNSGILDFAPDKKRLTKATFPEQLPEWFIKFFSYKSDIILDPFSGSGTTCYIAKKLNRNFIGIDISKNYCEIALNRIKTKWN